MIWGIVDCLFIAIDVCVRLFEISYFATWVIVRGIVGDDVRYCGGCWAGLNTIVCVVSLDEEIFGFLKLKTIEILGGGENYSICLIFEMYRKTERMARL